MIKSWLNLCLALLTAGTFYGQQAVQGGLLSSEPADGPNTLSGSYALVVDSFDWGAGVSKAVLTLEEKVHTVSPEQFQVMEEKQSREHSSVDMFQSQGGLTVSRTPRTVRAAYLSDGHGNAVTTSSNYVTLELAVGPDVGNPLCFHPEQEHYLWADPYQLVIDLAPGSTVTAGTSRVQQYTALAISRTPTARSLPLADPFHCGTFDGPRHTLSYASFSPAQTDSPKPLVIWLHGLGEGGTDPSIALVGGRAALFAAPQFQQLSGGAYVLVPQCPTFWLDDGSGSATKTGESCYTEDLMALIQHVLDTTPGVDVSRIYIGGCSNGGYMTMELLLSHPDVFAAAFPVCQAYEDSWISDEQLQLLINTPIWFVHSELDQVCPPARSTFPTAQRLLAAGGTSFRLTRLRDVSGPSGRYQDGVEIPYQYNPHYAWIPVLNGQISDPASGESLFSWLMAQSLDAKNACS